MLPEKPKRVCLFSKKEFLPKRTNQIFANKEYRIAYHNEISNSIRKKLYKINTLLVKNYKVLTEIMKGNNESEFHREFLRGKGFNFSVHTHFGNYEGVTTYAVYEFIYKKKDDTTYLIKRQ